MKRNVLHTPEGVRDIYSEECYRKITLEQKLSHLFHSYGYENIETPTFEFFDVFGNEIGTIPSTELYKFFDREGHTLVLRPDFTPSIARAASKYFAGEPEPARLCYKGNTFINHSSLQGRLKESTQTGVELIGDNTVDADAEMIVMVIEALLTSGLKDFQVSVGHGGYFDCLIQNAEIDEEKAEELKELIINKNTFAVEELLDQLDVSEERKQPFIAMPQLFGGMEALEKAAGLTAQPEALQAITRLKEIYEILKLYGYEKYVSFDLGMLGRYMYYTGIVFRAYTFGTGAAVVKGGRYDHLLEHFGKPAAAIGFVVVTGELLNALSRQKIENFAVYHRPAILVYTPNQRLAAIDKAKAYRKSGKEIAMLVMETEEQVYSYMKTAQGKEVITV